MSCSKTTAAFSSRGLSHTVLYHTLLLQDNGLITMEPAVFAIPGVDTQGGAFFREAHHSALYYFVLINAVWGVAAFLHARTSRDNSLTLVDQVLLLLITACSIIYIIFLAADSSTLYLEP